jgi:hypothetical protein
MDSKSTKKERQQTRKIGSGSPIKVTPSETASVAQENTYTGSALQQQHPASNTPPITAPSSTPVNTDSESKQIEIKPTTGTEVKASTQSEIKEKGVDMTLSTPDQKYTDTTVSNIGTHSTILEYEVDKKPILDEQANQDQQPSITEVKEDQKIQQVRSELEYTAEAEAVNKVEPTSHILQEPESRSLEETTTDVMKSNNQNVLTFKDESNTGIKDYKTEYYYNVNPFMTIPMLQLSWMEVYNEFAKNMAHWSKYWFDFFYELWPQTGTRISENNNYG